MNILNSPIYKHIKQTLSLPLADLFFFENLVVVQINEGMHVTAETSKNCFEVIYAFYETKNKPFGYLSNRINQYSIEVLDYKKYNNFFPNLAYYGIIGYSAFQHLSINIEKKFCEMPVYSFQNLNEAYIKMNNYILNKTSLIDSVN
ncbi:hypothetical protein [Olleya sp. HaHaR_3_96]|uniref:hypothetical protein n=1 Tax=Olleya sp. HaHaR_3_96 TaxID=2745560 RepID=UPI001C4F0D04|nr:hypothetical protein [Olleya sp. HaHaR_3_96]QXP59093.1 hypothetical protein H0I26_14365 [Olleya sp. HaHaR_3_96]